LMLGTRWYNF